MSDVMRIPLSQGLFDNEEDAAKAYDMAAQKYSPEYARLNFPSNGG